MEIHHHDPITSWRNHQRIQFLKGFYKNRQLVLQLVKEYEQTGEIAHEKIDRILETHVRSLKDISHVLYRMADERHIDRMKQRLFDKIMGEMWHELDKARNNIRLIEAYSGTQNHQTTPKGDTVWRKLSTLDRQILSSARRDLPQELERVKKIVDQLVPLFETILPIYRENEVVIRTLYFSKDYFDSLCPPSSVEYFFPLLFGSIPEGYLILIRSLIKTKHLKQSQEILGEFREWCTMHPEFQGTISQLENELKDA